MLVFYMRAVDIEAASNLNASEIQIVVGQSRDDWSLAKPCLPEESRRVFEDEGTHNKQK